MSRIRLDWIGADYNLAGEIDAGESEFDLESIKQKYGFCNNCNDTLFSNLSGGNRLC